MSKLVIECWKYSKILFSQLKTYKIFHKIKPLKSNKQVVTTWLKLSFRCLVNDKRVRLLKVLLVLKAINTELKIVMNYNTKYKLKRIHFSMTINMLEQNLTGWTCMRKAWSFRTKISSRTNSTNRSWFISNRTEATCFIYFKFNKR